MFITYLAFCEFIAVDFQAPDFSIWLTFIEFLVFNGLKPASINNYISAIKSMFKWFNIQIGIFEHPKIKHMLNAVEVCVRHPPVQKGIFDLSILERIILACELLPFSSIFKTIYLFAFFGFFRISNLAPSSKIEFKITKHLCRGDVLFHHRFLIVMVKWSKTLQASKKGTYIILPELSGSRLCPMSAFNNNVDVQAIKRHCTGTSDAVNAYIVADPVHTASVASSFQRLLT